MDTAGVCSEAGTLILKSRTTEHGEVFVRIEEYGNNDSVIVADSDGVQYILDKDNTFKVMSNYTEDTVANKFNPGIIICSNIQSINIDNSHIVINYLECDDKVHKCADKMGLSDNNVDNNMNKTAAPYVCKYNECNSSYKLSMVVKQIAEKYNIVDRLKTVGETDSDTRHVKDRVLEKFHQLYFEIDKEIPTRIPKLL